MLAAGPVDWVVVHSLDIAPWNRQHRTEIDFLVIIPDLGLLCVEVKSHNRIWVADGTWHPTTSIKRSPFVQSKDARYALAKGLARVWPHAENIPFGHCCIFPSADFDLADTVAVRPHELMDRRRFNALEGDAERCAELKEMFRTQLQEGGGQRPLAEPLSLPRIENILQACLPVQRRPPTAREEVLRREEEALLSLREQQRPVIQLAELNGRVVVTGGAGTGKTLIALELARRAATRGDRVALLCFNVLVGDWMQRQVAGTGLPNLVAGRAWRVMAELAGVRVPLGASSEYWDIELPSLLEERLTDPEFAATAQFDLLILDEAQDVLGRPRMWECLQQFIDGGLSSGRYVLMGDFEGQVLSGEGTATETLNALCSAAGPTRWLLSENCRNYQVIGDAAVNLSGLSPTTYSGYRRERGSIPVNYSPLLYASEEEQARLVEQCILEAKADGFKPSDITLLSMCAEERSIAGHLRRKGHQISPCREGKDGISSASVHAFKGMENKVIIATDIDLKGYENERDLFYVALTRATERVRILCSMDSKPRLAGWLEGGRNT
jgi:ATP:corrinoid adenosyltransferase